MSTAFWPLGLPFITSLRSLDEGGPMGDVLSISHDAGEDKLRRITTAAWYPISGSTPPLTPALYADFLSFWNGDLAGGVLRFYAKHPVDNTPLVFKPTADGYRPQPVGAGKRRVALSLKWRALTTTEAAEYAGLLELVEFSAEWTAFFDALSDFNDLWSAT